MKKVLLVILSLVLCISMLTGCAEKIFEEMDTPAQNNNDPTEAPNSENKVVENHADKQIAIDSFNKIDLTAFGDISTDYADAITKLIKETSFALKLNVNGSFGQEADVEADVKMKDGKLYFKVAGDNENGEGGDIEYFMILGENDLDFYGKMSDTANPENNLDWSKYSLDMTAFTEQIASAYNPEMISELLGKIVIPKLEEKYLTEKDDMLLLSNDYIIDLIVANVPLLSELSGADITNGDLEEFKEMGKKSLEEVGLAIYLGTGVDSITKLAVEATEETDSFYAEFALTDDAKAFDHFTLKVKNELGEGDVKYAPETVITAKSIYDAEGNAVGIDVDGTVYVTAMSYGRYEQVSENEEKSIRESIIQKATIDGVLDFGAIGKADSDIFKLDVDVETVKVIKTEKLQNRETGEETLLSVTEGAIPENDEKLGLFINLKSETENKAIFKFDMNEGEDVISAEGFIQVVDGNMDFELKVTKDGEQVFAVDGFTSPKDENTINFGIDLDVTDEGYLDIEGELYVGDSVVIPELPTDYDEIDYVPLFGREEATPLPPQDLENEPGETTEVVVVLPE